MFEWLDQDISAIKTPKFHEVDGPATDELRQAIMQANLPVPASYREFVLKFGNVKLYRRSRSGYRLGVFAGPRKATLNDGARIYHIGFHDGASVYVKPTFDSSGLPIFEFEKDKEEKVAEDFEEWLMESFVQIRENYEPTEWAKILRGPKPFTSDEQEIINARRLMLWKVLGINPGGNYIIEVTNTSCRSLRALTIGARSNDKRLNGAVRLNVNHIGPGHNDVLHVDCYKDFAPANEIELFSLPDPQPEDRDYYWEFKLNLTRQP
jgi:hypothetical protein